MLRLLLAALIVWLLPLSASAQFGLSSPSEAPQFGTEAPIFGIAGLSEADLPTFQNFLYEDDGGRANASFGLAHLAQRRALGRRSGTPATPLASLPGAETMATAIQLSLGAAPTPVGSDDLDGFVGNFVARLEGADRRKLTYSLRSTRYTRLRHLFLYEGREVGPDVWEARFYDPHLPIESPLRADGVIRIDRNFRTIEVSRAWVIEAGTGESGDAFADLERGGHTAEFVPIRRSQLREIDAAPALAWGIPGTDRYLRSDMRGEVAFGEWDAAETYANTDGGLFSSLPQVPDRVADYASAAAWTVVDGGPIVAAAATGGLAAGGVAAGRWVQGEIAGRAKDEAFGLAVDVAGDAGLLSDEAKTGLHTFRDMTGFLPASKGGKGSRKGKASGGKHRRKKQKNPPVRAGEGGRFQDLDDRARRGDNLEAHHIPQRAHGFTSKADGGAIVMPRSEHKATRNYGGRSVRAKAADAGRTFRQVLAQEIKDVRKIGGGRKYNRGLQQVTGYYRRNFPELMKKGRR